MDRADCAFCDERHLATEMVRGGRSYICAPCFTRAMTWSIAARASGVTPELPEADVACSFCSKKTPASALFRRGVETAEQAKDARICTACVARGFTFLTRQEDLDGRRETWRGLGESTPSSLLKLHFASAIDDTVTSSRTFPTYLRVDLNRALLSWIPAGARCVGLHDRYGHETMEFSKLTANDGYVSVAPLQHDEVDIGEERPARCLRKALWLFQRDGAPCAVLLTQQTQYGRSSGWHVEIAVLPGERGQAIVDDAFQSVERALSGAGAYRGKVLSLEDAPRTQGTGALVTVHRIGTVTRDEVILPPKTLELLERNVFDFARHRAALAKLGLPVKKGLLFYGPPGTGKTHTIRYLASALPGHTTLLVTADQVGLIEHYMTLARLLSPSILAIEDADLIARQREDMRGPCEEVLLNRLLNEMDGLKENAEILFVLTTNRPEALEVALRARPGRIDQAIEFPFPDVDGRCKLVRLYGKGAALSDETVGHIVARTAKVSAAFIKELMRRATQYTLARGAMEIVAVDVDAALDEMLFSGGRLNAALLGADERAAPGAG